VIYSTTSQMESMKNIADEMCQFKLSWYFVFVVSILFLMDVHH
jgi:hypothetical protein